MSISTSLSVCIPILITTFPEWLSGTEPLPASVLVVFVVLNCTRARKTLQTQLERMHGAGCVLQWFRTAESLGERRYEYTHTHI